MANTISITVSGQVTQGSLLFSLPQPSIAAVTLSNQGMAGGIQAIGFAAAEDLGYGDVPAASAGYLFMRNLDTTNYVQWGLNHAGTIRVVGRLMPGEYWHVVRVEPSAQIMLQAATAACNVEYYLFRA